MRGRIGMLCVAMLWPVALCAQTTSVGNKTNSDANTESAPNGVVVPEVMGFNASLKATGQHDSSDGWSSVLTPGVAWRFNAHFSVDADIPIYTYINVYANTGTQTNPVYQFETKNNAVGDGELNADFDMDHKLVNYEGSVTLGLPTGNPSYGLGAGQVTYGVNNHFERDFGIFTPDIELGVSDGSNQVGNLPVKSYVVVGTQIDFQAGTQVDLPLDMEFEAEAYEELPVGSTTVKSTLGGGANAATAVPNRISAEDNGFDTSLDVPLNPRVTLSGFYSRSLINKIDTAGISLTFQLRPDPD